MFQIFGARCFAKFTLSSFAALRTVRSGGANGLSMTESTAGHLDSLLLLYAGKGLPLVSSPKGNSAIPTTKASAVRATGKPRVP
jgi:hypothetical protein